MKHRKVIKNLILLIFIISVVLVLTYLLKPHIKDKYKDYAEQELYLLIYGPTNKTKDINIYFPEDMTWLSEELLTSAKIYQDDTCIDKSYNFKKGIDKNQLILSINEYIPEFNRIVIDNYKGCKLILHIAQHYVQDFSDLKQPDLNDSWFAGTGTIENSSNKLLMIREFTKGLNADKKDNNIDVYLNDKIYSLDYVKNDNLIVISENDKKVKFKYELDLNIDNVKKDNIKRLVIESIWIVENGETRFSILENKVPFRINDV